VMLRLAWVVRAGRPAGADELMHHHMPAAEIAWYSVIRVTLIVML